MTWVLVAVIVVLLVIIGLLVARQQRSRQLKQDFGPEYQRAVAQRGDQRLAEKELADRRKRLAGLKQGDPEYENERAQIERAAARSLVAQRR